MGLYFRLWLEEIEANTEQILRKINATYAQNNKANLSNQDLDALIQSLKVSPQLVSIALAKQQLDAKLGIQPKNAPQNAPDASIIRLAQKLTQSPDLQTFIDRYNQKNIQKDELLVAAYFLGLDRMPSVMVMMGLLKDIQELKRANKVKINFNKVPYINQEPFADFKQFSTKIHELKSSYEFEKNKKNLVTHTSQEGAVATSADGTISIYHGDSHKKCILHGKGTTFCISSKSSPQWYYTYRFEYGQSQYFIIDKNQKPPADLVNAGVAPPGKYSEWVDRKNSPNTITGFKSVESYKDYLNKHFDGNIDNILKPIPLSSEEVYLKKIVDMIENHKLIPDEIFNNKEMLMLILHMGYNIQHSDFVKLINMGPEYAQMYIMNLNDVKKDFEWRYLGRHPEFLSKWLEDQDELDNVEILSLLMNAEDPIQALNVLKQHDLLDFKVDKDVDALDIINDDNYLNLIKVALWLDQNYSKGKLWSLLRFYHSNYGVTIQTMNSAIEWLIKNKKDWTTDEIQALMSFWDDVLQENHFFVQDAWKVPAQVLVGKDFSVEDVYHILYLTNADEEIKKALGQKNLAKLETGDKYNNWKNLMSNINDKGSP
jgi:hypothetical protein